MSDASKYDISGEPTRAAENEDRLGLLSLWIYMVIVILRDSGGSASGMGYVIR
ncbi:hypothetical protein LI328DRAFT_53461 [Trichoderma asperelloides]|nr:hypothetical protein LI328DRAFT_53461 [Trichoderma asperelloides]